MAISPKKLIELTAKQVKKLDGLEAKIDATIKDQFCPPLGTDEELRIPLPRLTKAEIYHLENRYEGAGWEARVEEYQDPKEKPVLTLFAYLDDVDCQ